MAVPYCAFGPGAQELKVSKVRLPKAIDLRNVVVFTLLYLRVRWTVFYAVQVRRV